MLLYFIVTVLPIAFSQDFQVRWFRPRILGTPGHYINFVNTPQDFLLLHKRIYFDACANSVRVNDSADWYQWTIYDLNQSSVVYGSNSTECLHGWTAPAEGDYTLQVKRYNPDRTHVSSATARIFVKDIWMVALGDSFISGQGNPDKWGKTRAEPARWLNDTCFRSTASFSYLIYEKIVRAYPQHGVLFTFLACSDASIEDGLLGPQESQEAQVTDLLEPIVLTARSNASKSPDLVLLTIGSNDIGFFEVATQVLMGVISSNASFNRLQLPAKFSNLSRSLQHVSEKFLSYGIQPSDVFYFEYFDAMRNEKGQFDTSCGGLFFATDADFQVANDQFFVPLNAFIKNQSQIFGWNCVCNIAEAFHTHGYCSKESYIRSVQSALEIQGSGHGMYHPTYTGHKVVAEKAWPQIEKRLKSEIRI